MLIIAISTIHKQCSVTGIKIQLTLEFELPSPVSINVKSFDIFGEF